MVVLQTERRFSPLDELMPGFLYCYVLTFPLPAGSSQDQTCTLLQSALVALGKERPYLTAHAKANEAPGARPGSIVLEVPQPHEDIKLEVADLTRPGSGWKYSYRQLREEEMPPSKLDSRVLAPLTAGLAQTTKVFSAQANFVEGGLLLALCFHHPFADGSGASKVISRLAALCDGSPSSLVDNTNSVPTPEVFDFEKLRAKYSYDELKKNPDLWSLSCLDWGKKPEGYQGFDLPVFLPSLFPDKEPKVNASMFSFTADGLAAIKAQAKPSEAGKWVSTNDALVAFLWRHVVRARFPWTVEGVGAEATDETSYGIMALDGRKDLELPEGYIGNVIFHMFTGLPLRQVGHRATELSELALALRGTVNKTRNKKLLTDVVALAATLPTASGLNFGSANLGKDFYTTSWIDLPFYEDAWGPLGKVDFFRIPYNHFESLCCIMPPRNGSGVVDVVVSMQGEAGDRLRADREFAEYAKLISSPPEE